MRISSCFIGIALVLTLISCSTTSEAPTGFEKLFQSKRYKETVIDRDRLITRNRQLINDTTKMGSEIRRLGNEIMNLGSEIRKMKSEYSVLKGEFEDLSEKSRKEVTQLNDDLKSKSDELDSKEKLLQDREQRLKEMEAVISKQDSLTQGLNDIVKNALLGFKSDELSVEMKNGKVYVSMTDKLLFQSGKAFIEEKGKQAIKKLAEVLNRDSDIDIAIEGHTDNVPIKTNLYKDNWDLSVARATAIVRMLSEEYEVNPTRLTASGKGEYFPVASNEEPEGRAKNRRTDIILSPKLDELFEMLQNSTRSDSIITNE